MKITLRELQIFTFTAKTSNISQAAEQAFISQSGASLALSQLEGKLGRLLFQRVGRRLILSEFGKELLPKAIHILDLSQAFESAFGKQGELIGNINFAASTTVMNYILPAKIAQSKAKYPEVGVSVFCGNTKCCIEKLLNFKVEFAIVEGIFRHKDICYKPWLKDELVIFVHPKHPLAMKKNISLADLTHYSWVCREEGSGTAGLLNAFLLLHKLDVSVDLVLDSSYAIKESIKHTKNAVACLSRYIIANDLKSKKFVELKIAKFNIQRYFYIATNTNYQMSQVAEYWLEQLA